MTYESFVQKLNQEQTSAFSYLSSFGGYHWLWDVLYANDSIHNMGFADFIEANPDEFGEALSSLEQIGATGALSIFNHARDAFDAGDTECLEELDQSWFGEGYTGFEDAIIDYARSNAQELYNSLTESQRQADFLP